ncbi:MAG: AAA family ATPase [Verrucomicrobia bacterium]|jgi:general secretion pathway protein A|nr:AAA family ATPase [Verrucomicrobiota bacterium]
MSYYRVLGLEREPFSTSPDPDFFHNSAGHRAALCRLQIAIALKRGLSVMIGDIGTGKTTVSRKLSRALNEDENVTFRMILNPYFRTEKQFLSRLAALFHVPLPSGRMTSLDYMEAIERYLFTQGVERNRTVVLLIDEAQILPDFVFEVLRILLNYETNEFKILQVVLVGQMELLPRVTRMANFWDRVSAKVMLKPLAVGEVRELIDARLRAAGYRGTQSMFSAEAVGMICEHTDGFPRRVNLLCHNALEHMVMHDKRFVDLQLVHRVIESEIASDDFKGLLDEEGAEDQDAARMLRVVGA